MIIEHQCVILTNDLAAAGLIHGETAAIATVDSSSIRPVTQRDMTHARLIKQPA